jgi:hypothetical protein
MDTGDSRSRGSNDGIYWKEQACTHIFGAISMSSMVKCKPVD